MKQQFLFISTILILMISGTLSAQYVPLTLEYKTDNSTLIVEGKVTGQRSFIDENDEIFTENIIEVSKVHKGDFTEPQLSVITFGGTVGERTTVWSHLLDLNRNEYGVFFLTPSKRPKPQDSQFLTFDVFGGSQGFYHFQRKDNGVHRAAALLDVHNSVSEFYQVIGATDFNESPFVSPFDMVHEDDCLLYRIEPISGSSFNLPQSNSFTANSQIWFNVYVKIKNGDYKLNKSEIILKYSTQWFYPNMVTDGYISFVQGEFDQTAYSFNISDVDTNIVRLKTEAITSNYNSLESVNQEWKLIASVGVTLKNISDEEPLEQQLDVNYTIENNYRTSEGYIEDFECVKLEYGANCGMEITSVTPRAAAGVGVMSENGITGVVEIVGDNFLDDEPVIGDCIKPDDHHVKFRTIDNNWIAPLEGDYLEYTNTTIRVKVPTKGYENNSNNIYSEDEINDAVACTGEVRVCRKGFLGIVCGCFVTSDTDVYIPFAAKNTIQTNSDGCKESVRMLLRNINGTGGYTVRFQQNFKDLTGAVEAFKRALTTWRCATQVHFEVDEVGVPVGTPGNCIVRMSSLGAGVRGATSFNFKNCGSEPNVNFSQSHEGFLMSFNSDFNWHTGTNMPPLNWNDPSMGTLQADMESTALHELGHAHLLLHTCNTPNVMVRPGPSDYRRVLTMDDEDGGDHISMLSSTQAATSCDGSSMILIDLADCDITPVVEINRISYEFSVFPNPTNSSVFVKLKDNSQKLGGHLSIFNGQGILVGHSHFRGGEAEFNISSFPSGIYYIQYVSETNSSFFISKIIKE